MRVNRSTEIMAGILAGFEAPSPGFVLPIWRMTDL
jgi:hypothetical protein